MKSTKYIKLLCMLLLPTVFISCNKDDEYFDEKYQSTPITVTQVYLEDYESSVPDRPITYARLGQLIRIEGSGFYGMKKVYINGYDTYFNRAYVTDNSMLVSINSDTPVSDAEPEERNIIRFVKNNTELSYNFTIRAASPTITSGRTAVWHGTSSTPPAADSRCPVRADRPGESNCRRIRPQVSKGS